MVQLRQKIGQMLIMGFSGFEIDSDSPVVKWLQEDGLGGVLLFNYDFTKKAYGKNIRDKEQIQHLTHQLKQYSRVPDFGASSNEIDRPPLFIALDYEGGPVDRLSQIDGCMTTINAREQALLSEAALDSEADKMAKTLHELGFNLNFAPVVDLSINEEQGIIGKLGRSFSASPEVVVRAAKQFVRAFSSYGITCAYKHFPGHGSACGDTHEGFVDVTDHYHNDELIPYKALLNDSTLPKSMVMTAHVINRHLDESGLPATLSHTILSDLLRTQIGFDGVVISDDLQMQAISNHYTLDEALCLTLNAGADMLIFGNQLGDVSATEVVNRIEHLVTSGVISHSRIEQAYQRIVRLKQKQIATVLERV